ncbi:MAG TPA: 2-oxoacid ferredoxin oxidoreductase, partial [bacterium]|nr:2-oxoacid ferredoxin oxidoreductase [bacterium]
AIAYDISFVARGYSGKPKELTDLIIQGVEHKGFALIEVLSPCTTFHDTYKPVSQRIRFVDPSHDPADRIAAMKLAFEKDYIPLGVIYKSQRSSFDERVDETQKRAQAKGPGDLDHIFNLFQ